MEDNQFTQMPNYGKNINYPDDDKSAKKHTVAVSKIRCSASQLVAVLATNIAKFTHGTLLGYVTIVLAELYKEDAEIDMTLNELTWFSSNCFMSPVGALIIGLLTQSIGSRYSIMIATILQTISWVMFYCATNSAMLLIASSIVGFVYSVSLGPGCTYIAEICQPDLRATLLASNNLFLLIGNFCSVLLGTMMNWRSIALVNCSFPIVGFIAMYFVPDSPHWLASKGRMIQAEHAMAWLRGWTTPQCIQQEFSTLKEIHHNPDKNLVTNLSNKKNISGSSRTCLNLKETLRPYLQRSFCRPLASACCIFALHTFMGSLAIVTYIIIIFEMIDSPVEKYTAAAIFDGLKVCASISCIIVINYIGKRRLVFTSMTGTIMSYLTISIVAFLVSQNYISTVYSWIPTIMTMFATFLTSGGIDKVVYMLNVEIFPTQFRGIGAGIGLFLSSFLSAVVNKIFLYMVNGMTLPGVYLFFATVNITALILFYFMIPETNGRTLKEIEDHFTGVKKIKRRPKNTLETS
ncbi:hypothetical protein TSAR_007245 [Trichomalopsis sarcophagae]|uniref:Major facilitator superfamily (MFS) profile domain-containing protein n=1 Tax=Trichomalopsis sarcophagae TaxID=543379 RepID=A0A232EW81_9HYME|nr:hypothetical protein TSAR_007245 [Trichomalopsis sarcophagae]